MPPQLSNLFTPAYSSRFASNATVRSTSGFSTVVVTGADLPSSEMNVTFTAARGVGARAVEDARR